MKDNFKRIFARFKKSYVLIIILSCGAFFYLSYFLFLSSEMDELTLTLQQQQDIMKEYDQNLAQQAVLTAEVSHAKEINLKLDFWQKNLEKSSEIPEVLNEILKYGGQNNLQFNLFSPGGEVIEKKYTKIPIKIIVLGNYHQIANFISAVANMKWVIKIPKIAIAKNPVPKETEPTTRLRSEINLELYILGGKKT